MLTNQSNRTGTLYVLKPVSRDKDKKALDNPYFEISESVDGKFKAKDDKSINIVSGRLFRIETKQEEYDGDKFYRARIYLRDGEESYMISTRLNIASRSLINCLFSLTSFDNISVKFYRSKAGFESFYVSQNDEKVSWKFDNSELPEPKSVVFKNKTIRDFTDVDQFFADYIVDFNNTVKSTNSAVSQDEPEVSQAEPEAEQGGEENQENDTPVTSRKGKKNKKFEDSESDVVPF
jgi:hypothetical protein